MNEKLKISLVSASAFAVGAASMAGFLAWTFASAMKELKHRKPTTYKRYSQTNES